MELSKDFSLMLYCVGRADGDNVSFCLPFVADNDDVAIERVKKSAEGYERTINIDGKFLYRVGSFSPFVSMPILGDVAEKVCSLSDILKVDEKEEN